MKKHLTLQSRLKSWTLSTLLVGSLAFGLFQESAHAKRHRIVLPDGVEVVFDINGPEATITLSGTSKNSYKIEASEDLQNWVVLRNRALLGNSGTFTYTDSRGLEKCFYRIMINENGANIP